MSSDLKTNSSSISITGPTEVSGVRFTIINTGCTFHRIGSHRKASVRTAGIGYGRKACERSCYHSNHWDSTHNHTGMAYSRDSGMGGVSGMSGARLSYHSWCSCLRNACCCHDQIRTSLNTPPHLWYHWRESKSQDYIEATHLEVVVLSLSCQFSRSLPYLSALTPADSHSLPNLSALTPTPIRAHSHSLPHVLMHEYLWEDDKSRGFQRWAW